MPGFGNLVEIILDRRPLPGSPVSLEAATDGVDASAQVKVRRSRRESVGLFIG